MASQEKKAPEATFSSLVLTLGTSAWVSLGKVADPATGKVREDFDSAKYVIDTLLMLREKTEGNLDSDEQKLLNGFISELQVNYAEIVLVKKEKPSDTAKTDGSVEKDEQENK